jgi:hypothetical protein
VACKAAGAGQLLYTVINSRRSLAEGSGQQSALAATPEAQCACMCPKWLVLKRMLRSTSVVLALTASELPAADTQQHAVAAAAETTAYTSTA